ncbi:MAG: hypothetical protein ACRDAM_16015 [Casimicrobium sp.]
MKSLVVFAVIFCYAAFNTYAQTTDKVTLNDARIVIEHNGSSSSPSWSVTLRPRWTNANGETTRVRYKVSLFNSANDKIYERENTVSIDRFSTDARTQTVAYVFGRSSDEFRAEQVSTVRVIYAAAGDPQEKEYRNVPIERTVSR